MTTLNDIADAVTKIGDHLPEPVREGAEVVGLVLKGADGIARFLDAYDVDDAVQLAKQSQAMNQAAGEAANKAAKLAGIRAAIERIIAEDGRFLAFETMVSRILAEIARRL
jgi:hypothetical protein